MQVLRGKREQSFRKKIDAKAVFLGWLVYLILGAIFAVFYTIGSALEATKNLQIYQITLATLTLIDSEWNILHVVFLIVGLAFAFVSGFVAGRLVRKNKQLHGALVGTFVIFSGFIHWGGGFHHIKYPKPLWCKIIEITCLIPAGLLGGALSEKNTKKIEFGGPGAKNDK